MPEVVEMKKLLSEVKKMREDLDYIREHMVDVDMFMTEEEEERLQESLQTYDEGKAIPLEEFENEMNR